MELDYSKIKIILKFLEKVCPNHKRQACEINFFSDLEFKD